MIGTSASTVPVYYVNSTATTATTATIWPWQTQIFSVFVPPAYNQLVQVQQMAAIMLQQRAYNEAQMLQQHQEQQLRRDYAATEAARVIEPARALAADRARGLLLQHLSEEQRRTFEAHKWFVVEGGKSKRRFRIIDQGNLVANVQEIDRAGNVLQRLCAHGPTHLPLADNLLTQKIMLEHADDEFLRVANRH
jgi:hypothetical protein